METKSLGEILKTAVLAGLIAGAVAAGFHSLVTEPVMDRAIQIEEQLSQSQGVPAKEPVLSRPAQRVGLVLGFLFYGGAWGLLFGALFYWTRSWQRPGWSVAKQGFVLVLLLGWSVAVFPFLKYPANPPGVGDPETIGYRQWLYLGFIALSFIGAVGAFRFQRWVSGTKRSAWSAALSLYAVYLAVIYLAMPSNPDPVRMPPQIIWTFRTLSLGGLLLLWGVLAGLFTWLHRGGRLA